MILAAQIFSTSVVLIILDLLIIWWVDEILETTPDWLKVVLLPTLAGSVLIMFISAFFWIWIV